MFFNRTVENALRSVDASFPVLLLTGARQVGKSTLLDQMAEPGRKRVSLDNPTFRALAKSDPGLFIQRYSPPVLIDEVQYAPELFDHIKVYVDSHQHYGDFWLTGSQTFSMMQNVTESLAGRVGVIRMMGLSNSEIGRNRFDAFRVEPDQLVMQAGAAQPMDIAALYERVFIGSMPRLHTGEAIDREIFFESYLETYLSRDVKSLSQVGDELSFLNFMAIVAARTATTLNYATLASEAGISAPTAKQWLSLLVSSGIVLLIPPFANNALKRVVKSPRMYFADTGLCAYLTRHSSPETLEGGNMDGQFFETWVVSEIYKSYLHNGKQPPLHYYRDSSKREIDLIIASDGAVSPIEIKKASTPRNATKGFSALAPIEQDVSADQGLEGSGHIKSAIGLGAVICMSPDVMPLDQKNWLVPPWVI